MAKEEVMPSSGGFEKTNDNPIHSPDSAQEELHQAGKADARKRERRIEKVTRGEKHTSGQPAQQASARRDDTYEPSSPVRTSGRKPGEVSPELGQDSGTDWQESQQMGRTGHGGVQNPQKNP